MLDLQKLFNFSELTKRLEKRGVSRTTLFSIKNKLVTRNRLIEQLNTLRAERNKLSVGVEAIKNSELVSKINEEIQTTDLELKQLEKRLANAASKLPNLASVNTPFENKEISLTNYEKEHFLPLEHNFFYKEIMQKLDLIDENKSFLLSGSKSIVYKETGVELLYKMIRFLLSQNKKNGYKIYNVPHVVCGCNLYNTGQLPKFAKNLYKITNGGNHQLPSFSKCKSKCKKNDHYLIPTAEVALVNLYQTQTIEQKCLPLKISGYSSCFRNESASAGTKNKSLFRLREFHKVEIVRIVEPDHSYGDLEQMVEETRKILHLLKISHRVVDLCYAELGFSASKTYDIELWLPKTKMWLEISSCSNCEDFQSRRAQIKIKEKKQYVHTLNGSCLAIDRLIIALCEYYYDVKKNRLILPKLLDENFFQDTKIS